MCGRENSSQREVVSRHQASIASREITQELERSRVAEEQRCVQPQWCGCSVVRGRRADDLLEDHKQQLLLERLATQQRDAQTSRWNQQAACFSQSVDERLRAELKLQADEEQARREIQTKQDRELDEEEKKQEVMHQST